MLVLLIIFMVTAPMMTQGVDVDLPETTAKPLRQKEDPLIVTIKKDGQIYFNDIKLDQSLLRQQLNDGFILHSLNSSRTKSGLPIKNGMGRQCNAR